MNADGTRYATALFASQIRGQVPRIKGAGPCGR